MTTPKCAAMPRPLPAGICAELVLAAWCTLGWAFLPESDLRDIEIAAGQTAVTMAATADEVRELDIVAKAGVLEGAPAPKGPTATPGPGGRD